MPNQPAPLPDPAAVTPRRADLPKSDFRQGRRVPRNVYHGDEPLFMAATAELAAELVTVLNAGADAIRRDAALAVLAQEAERAP